MDNRLVLICEGDAHSVEYFHHNGVFPGAVVFTPSKFKEMMPYLTVTDDVLLVIKGLTDFTLAEVYALIHDLADAEDRLFGVTILSNVDLGVTALPYYFYEGDLFYGQYRRVRMGKYSQYVLDKQDEDNLSKKDKKANKARQAEKTRQSNRINPVIERYKLYKRSNNKMVIYGSENKHKGIAPDTSDEFLKNRIAIIDAFADKNNTDRE